jgi:hypothetical protein
MICDVSDQEPETDFRDRRILQRHVAICRVGLIHSGAARDFCRIKNISAGGFMARIYHETSVGDEVQVEMKSGQLFQGSVVWARDDHVGIAFRDRIDVDATLSNQNAADAGYRPRLPRIGVDYRVRLRCGSRYHSGRVCDLSQSGAQVQISGSLALESPVSVMLRDFPAIPGSVRWTRGTHAGISFNESVRLEPLARWIQDRRAEPPGTSLLEPAVKPRIPTRNQS